MARGCRNKTENWIYSADIFAEVRSHGRDDWFCTLADGAVAGEENASLEGNALKKPRTSSFTRGKVNFAHHQAKNSKPEL